MADLEAKKPAAESARGLPGSVHLGRSNCSLATPICSKSQVLARITAPAENHLRELEWRIGHLGALVGAGHADRSLFVERLGVAIELARLEDASFEPKVDLQNCSFMPEDDAPGFTEEEIERAAATPQGEQMPIKSRHQIYYAKNREKVRERQRPYYVANHAAMCERYRKYYAENSERELERLHQFYFRNRERILEQKRAARSARATAPKGSR
jgi:hypothetical protein